MNFVPIENWGQLPDGWRYVEVAGVAVDSKDRVFCFTRGEHPVIVFDRDGALPPLLGRGQVRRAHGITIDADDTVWLTDDLHHTVAEVHAGGQAPPHHRRPRHAGHAPGRPAVQPAHPRRHLPADRLPLRVRRLRQLARPQVRARRHAT